jgi:hypothetical protein
MTSRPGTLQSAIVLAAELSEELVHSKGSRVSDMGVKRKWDNSGSKSGKDGGRKMRKFEPKGRKDAPKCKTCGRFHSGVCRAGHCGKCGRMGHSAHDCGKPEAFYKSVLEGHMKANCSNLVRI